MIVISSTNGRVGIGEAIRVLRSGGKAVDAVEAGIRFVEANPEDHSVGYGGFPNLLGQVELDAAIMNGRTLEAGAVGSMQGFCHAISVARHVMEKLPHVFLVGDGAARFAAEMGCEPSDLLTETSHERWKKELQSVLTADDWRQFPDLPDLWRWVAITADPERTRGTVNMIARDAHGDLAVGVSTSGWAWKYPGRVGDSPVVGAGLYADNRYGAAACTGMGEMAIRAGTARSLVLYLKMGLSLDGAGQEAMSDLDSLGGRYLAGMSFLVLGRDGSHTGFCSTVGSTYLAMTPEMDEPVVLERVHVALAQRWGTHDA